MPHSKTGHSSVSHEQAMREHQQWKADYERRRGPTPPMTEAEKDHFEARFRHEHRHRASHRAK